MKAGSGQIPMPAVAAVMGVEWMIVENEVGVARWGTALVPEGDDDASVHSGWNRGSEIRS
jgi:hypothetical protein